jgi:branched-chain amino acid aminotransferase
LRAECGGGGDSGQRKDDDFHRLSLLLTTAIEETLAANHLRDARIRLTVSAGRGVGRPDLSTAKAPTVLVVAEPAPPPPDPARLTVASLRIDEGRPLAFAKHANYLASLLALSEARGVSCHDALLLNRAGHVAEAATSNVFVVRSGALLTPPLADGPLPGVTREAILECAAAAGVPAEGRSLTLEAMQQADEVFLTNSVIGARPVTALIDRWEATQVPGPVTGLLARCYAQLVREECGLKE